jgi:hypothetical protein
LVSAAGGAFPEQLEGRESRGERKKFGNALKLNFPVEATALVDLSSRRPASCVRGVPER